MSAVLMTVPETPVDEYRFFSSDEYDVRMSRKLIGVKSIPIPHDINQLTDQ